MDENGRQLCERILGQVEAEERILAKEAQIVAQKLDGLRKVIGGLKTLLSGDSAGKLAESGDGRGHRRI